MNNQLTVLIPTSPIPSHPSTAILDETIANIRKYTDAEIVIMFDGIHPSLIKRADKYTKYRQSVAEKYSSDESITLSYFPSHEHQTGMTRVILDTFVDTPLIMFCEHDTSPIGDIPFQQLCDFVQHAQEINYLRFNIFENIPLEHEYLMLDKQPIIVDDVPITRTIQWSQRPHIAKTDWYRKILAENFPEGFKGMIEDVMHGKVQDSYNQHKKDLFGLAIYTPPGNQLRSYHSDGRGADEKIIQA